MFLSQFAANRIYLHMETPHELTLVNLQNGNLAFKVHEFDGNSNFEGIQRLNYYSLIWVTQGSGTVKVDFAEYAFGANTLFAFAPYQPFMFVAGNFSGIAVHFHPDFFCIIKAHSEVACNGVLFNNIYQPPFVNIDATTAATLGMVIGQMRAEMQNPVLAQHELLVSYLKILLISASRLKVAQQPQAGEATAGAKEPFILQTLKDEIEKNFKTKHSASDYAGALNITAKALGKITKAHFNKTLTGLIAERIIIEAKRELYLTNKTVKEIAYELGYPDEYYFSRFFKTNADISPQVYRDTVGFGRGVQ